MATALDAAPRAVTPLPLQRTYGRGRTYEESWLVTVQDRDAVWARMTTLPFLVGCDNSGHKAGLGLLLNWLEEQPGVTWQDRWLASGADADHANGSWRELPLQWLSDRGHTSVSRQDAFFRAVNVALAADLFRPSLTWLVTSSLRRGALPRAMEKYRDGVGFARLRQRCGEDPSVSTASATRVAYRTAQILAAKGGAISDVTSGDVLELLEVEAELRGTSVGATHLFYRVLHDLGVFGDQAPATLRELRSAGQRTPEELIDRYDVACRPIRDLFVDYLRERQPALDYNSLEALSYYLAKLFWSDLERHHPGIDSLHLPTEVAHAWKQRLRTVDKTVRTPDGRRITTQAPRINYRECLTPVRAFYLDLAHWAVEEPSRWARWVTPCPVGSEEINRKKDKRRRKSRMDARTRERLPVLPVLVRSVDRRRKDAAALLVAARDSAPGETFTAAGQTLVRVAPRRSAAAKILAEDPAAGRRRDLGREEDHAFWAFAVVEVLRATGIRVEELTELSHHSLIQYRLPTTGELIPLLQIIPSKTDIERLLVVSPELADVLSTIICRIRDTNGKVPRVPAYDHYERTWLPPSALLFQRHRGGENRAISSGAIRKLLTTALAHTGLTDSVAGGPLHFTPHDFRRLFITDAVLSGLPPHIAQVVAGHQDINVTLGYKAVYPDEAVQAHLAFLARRRAMRPSDEYRVPTDEEWTEFLGHFERRKVSTGTCGRSFGTPCIHEHACVRCPMLWPDPAQRDRLVEIRDNLIARIAEAEREGWLGDAVLDPEAA